MARFQRFSVVEDDVEEIEGADRQTMSLAGLAVALFLVVLGLFLVKTLRHETRIEDCMMAGRTNCMPPIVQDYGSPQAP
jgi:hypothetical protein